MDQNSPSPHTEAEKAAKLGGDATAATGDEAAPRPLVAAAPIEVVDLLTNHVRTMQHIEDTLGEVLRRVLAAAVNVVGEEATRELLAKLDAAAAHARAVQSQLRANPTPRLSGVPGYTGGVDIAADGGVSVAAPPAGGLAGGTPNP